MSDRERIARARHSSAAQRLMRLALGLAYCACGCARSDVLDQRVDRINQVLLDATAAGAMRCAPRQLAVAHSQLEFAQLEREQGFRSKADGHLQIADRHAEAAKLLSMPQHCPAAPAPRSPEAG